MAQREVERFEGLQPAQRPQAAAHLLAQREGERLEGLQPGQRAQVAAQMPAMGEVECLDGLQPGQGGQVAAQPARTRKGQALYIDEIMAITSALRLQGSQRILTPSFVIS